MFSWNEKVEKVVVEEEIKVNTVEKKKVEAKNIVKVIPPAPTNGFQFRKWVLFLVIHELLEHARKDPNRTSIEIDDLEKIYKF